MGSEDAVNPTSFEVFLGADVMLFENTGSVLFFPWDSDCLNPRSPLAKELHDRYGSLEGGRDA